MKNVQGSETMPPGDARCQANARPRQAWSPCRRATWRLTGYQPATNLKNVEVSGGEAEPGPQRLALSRETEP